MRPPEWHVSIPYFLALISDNGSLIAVRETVLVVYLPAVVRKRRGSRVRPRPHVRKNAMRIPRSAPRLADPDEHPAGDPTLERADLRAQIRAQPSDLRVQLRTQGPDLLGRRSKRLAAISITSRSL